MTASTIDAETLRRATVVAEDLNATSDDEDVLLVAGVFIQLLAQERWSGELRTDTEWIPLPVVNTTKEGRDG